ncbi:MAG: HAD-IA family hydrolase [Streptosporangiales bacterium]|nr:HAD-IA family hydrolase [Streptosporangiales bacterium]
MADSAVRWVVFDYGEVISRRTAELPTLATLLGVAADDFADAYWSQREAYDRGCTDAEYWGAVAGQLGREIGPDLVDKLTDVDVRGWLQPVEESLALVGELHRTGVPIAVLSNAPASFGRALRQQDWVRQVDQLLISADLRSAKPDAAIWAELIDRVQAHPAELLFFDDKPTNVVGAHEAGLQTQVWTDAAAGRATLVEYGLLT